MWKYQAHINIIINSALSCTSFCPLHLWFCLVKVVVKSWKPEDHWSIKLNVNSPAMLFISFCVFYSTTCFPTFTKCRFPLCTGTGVWGKLRPILTSSPSTHMFTLCKPAPFPDILALFNTSSLHVALFVTMQLPLQHSWVMTAHSSVQWRKGAAVHTLERRQISLWVGKND